MTKVKCTVASCNYWGENNECHADEIVITENYNETEKFGEAKHDSHTKCRTFEPKKEQ